LRRHYRFVRSFYAHVPAFDNDWAFLACSDAVDVAAVPRERIEDYVAGLRGESYFYDAETHVRLFSLPLYLRRELQKDGDVF
jgi:spermidine synthase